MDLQLIKAAFDKLDRNGDGIVNIREFIISVRKGEHRDSPALHCTAGGVYHVAPHRVAYLHPTPCRLS